MLITLAELVTKNQHTKITINIYIKHNIVTPITLSCTLMRFRYGGVRIVYAQ